MPDTITRTGHRSREREGTLPNAFVIGWTSLGWAASFALMAAQGIWLDALGVLLCAHTMVLAAYLVHEAAHHNLFASAAANRRLGEWMSFVAGSSYGSFERIRHMHLRHHRDRVDVACFDFKALLARRPWLRRLLEAGEWAYLPATDLLMHAQVLLRPFLDERHARHRARVVVMLVLRGMLLIGLGAWSLKALLLYALAYLLFLRVLNFFDAFHHTFEQVFIEPEAPPTRGGRTHAYEQANTFSNLVSLRWPALNLLTLNFGFHNAHHERVAVPWYRLPDLHRSLFGEGHAAVMSVRSLLRAWHRHRVRRVAGEAYGAAAGSGAPAATADFVGAHGVSFLTVI